MTVVKHKTSFIFITYVKSWLWRCHVSLMHTPSIKVLPNGVNTVIIYSPGSDLYVLLRNCFGYQWFSIVWTKNILRPCKIIFLCSTKKTSHRFETTGIVNDERISFWVNHHFNILKCIALFLTAVCKCIHATSKLK